MIVNRAAFLRITCMLLCLTLLSGVLPVGTALADSYTPQPAKAYTVYTPVGSTADEPRTIYFTEDYFSAPATQYQPSLASATMGLAMSAFGSNMIFQGGTTNYTKSPRNFVDFMGKLGFTGIYTNPYFSLQPTTDGIAYGIAYKLITVDNGSGQAEQVPLIAVGVRGSNYQSEWASNVTVGQTGDHAGFAQAANEVIAGLKGYIDAHSELKSKRIKLWISGFSRAAATSNMASGYLDRAIAANNVQSRLGASLAKEDLYCYTFETPAGCVDGGCNDRSVYGNIFNLINPNDVVPQVAPYFTGDDDFRRFGTDLFFPSTISDWNAENGMALEAKMKAAYKQLSGQDYIVDQFKNWRLRRGIKQNSTEHSDWFEVDGDYPQSSAFFCGRFLNELIHGGIGSRTEYVNNYQPAFQTMMGFLCGAAKYGTAEQQAKFMSYITDNALGVMVTLVVGVLIRKDVEWEPAIAASVYDVLKMAKDYSSLAVPDSELKNIGAAIAKVLTALWKEGETKGLMAISNNVNLVASFYFGVSNVLQAHDSDLCMAWLTLMDPNYTGTNAVPASVLTDYCGEYRIVTVKGYTDTKLTADDGTLLSASTAEGFATELKDELVDVYCAPSNQGYSLTIASNPSGSDGFYLQVAEYSPVVGDVKGVATYTVRLPIAAGVTYRLSLPAYTTDGYNPLRNGKLDGLVYTTAYQLQRNDGSGFVPVTDAFVTKSLTELRANYCELEVKPNNSFGAAVGGGTKRSYSLARLQAITGENGEFIGWADDTGANPELRDVRSVVVMPAAISGVPNTYTAQFTYGGKPLDVIAYDSGVLGEASTVTVCWVETVAADPSLIAGYRIYRQEEGSPATRVKVADQLDANVFEWMDTAVEQGKTYLYTVHALAADPVVEGSGLWESVGVSDKVQIGTPWTLTDSATGVAVSGYSLGGDAPDTLMVVQTERSSEQNHKMNQQAGDSYITSMTVSVNNSEHVVDGYRVSIPAAIPSGRVPVLQHDPNPAGEDRVDTLTAVVANGCVTAQTSVRSLGQFYLTAAAPLDAPTHVQASNTATRPNGGPEITVTWQSPARQASVTGYHVYRNGVQIATVNGASSHAYVNSGSLVVGQTYRYTVRAFNSHGEGSVSDPATVVAAAYWRYTKNNVTVSGYSVTHAPDGIQVTLLPEGDTRTRHFPKNATEQVVNSFDIAFTNADAQIAPGTMISVTLPVPSSYDGQQLTVRHDRDEQGSGSIESFLPTAQSGKVTVLVTSLSPFQITAPVVVPPITGDNTPLALMIALMLLSAGLGWMMMRRRRVGE